MKRFNRFVTERYMSETKSCEKQRVLLQFRLDFGSNTLYVVALVTVLPVYTR